MRRRVNATGVVAVLALVFAMSGGAFAAGRYLITSTKQISPKVLKALKGNAGAAGAKGAAGAAGAAGAVGAVGATGAGGPAGGAGVAGADGASVTSKEIKVGEAECAKLGGSQFTSVSGKTTACNGREGSPWTAGGKLPSGSSETGSWESSVHAEGFTGASISFPVRLAESLDHEHVFYVTSEQQTNHSQAACPGSVEEPEADAGDLCVYQGGTWLPEGGAIKVENICAPSKVFWNCGEGRGTSAGEDGAGESGAVMEILYEGTESEKVVLDGSWAVTAP